VIILAIESSCDETAIAVLKDGRTILADHLSSQIDLHKKYGGVVPELACRRHIEVIGPLFKETLEKSGVPLSAVDAIAVTAGPGLVGALLVGVSFGKSLSYSLGIPLLAVHHLAGHINAAFIEHSDIVFPAVALVVSGGHTNLYAMAARGDYRLIGKTIDDAAGEALDKGARMLGFAYPGGPIIDELAKKGNIGRFDFPRPYRSKVHCNFSFSGLKTSLRQKLLKLEGTTDTTSPQFQADIAAGYQSAIVESLVEKTFQAIAKERATALIVSGGVAANSLLRKRMKEEGIKRGIPVYIPSPQYCTDNAAMIAMAGSEQYDKGRFASHDLNPDPNLLLQ